MHVSCRGTCCWFGQQWIILGLGVGVAEVARSLGQVMSTSGEVRFLRDSDSYGFGKSLFTSVVDCTVLLPVRLQLERSMATS